MGYFPFFVDIKDKNCLIVGGGTIALRKIQSLLSFGPNIRVVAPVIDASIKSLEPQITLIERTFKPEDIDESFFVIAATDDSTVNKLISELCKNRKIPVNVVDQLEECSFLFPALVHKGDITVGITTAGKSPVLSSRIRRKTASLIPDYYDELVEYLGKIRETIKDSIPSYELRTHFYEELFSNTEEQDCFQIEKIECILNKYRKIQEKGGLCEE